jgi:TetR/AcrR family transcriptional repressor of mexJK operon
MKKQNLRDDAPLLESGLRQPRQARSQRSLDRLFQAVEAFVSTKGLDSLTLSELLRDSQVSNGTFYARFPSKDALVRELQDRVLSRLEASMEGACDTLKDPISLGRALSGMVSALAGEFRAQAGLLGSLIRHGGKDEIMQRRAARTHAVIEALFLDVLAPWMRALGPPDATARIVMAHNVLSAALMERVSHRLDEAGRADDWDTFIAEMSRLLMAYVASAHPETEPPALTLKLTSDAGPEPAARPMSAFSQRKNEQILNAAFSLFASRGFGPTTMAMVAAEAGVGKATVYAHFQSKSDLFAAVVAHAGEPRIRSLDAASEDPIEMALQKFGREAFELLMHPNTLAFFRIIAAESARFPELGQIFYDAGPAKLQAALAAFLAEAMQRGELRSAPAHLAACQFLALISGDLQLRSMLGATAPMDAAEHDHVLRSGVAAFLTAYAPDSPREKP